MTFDTEQAAQEYTRLESIKDRCLDDDPDNFLVSYNKAQWRQDDLVKEAKSHGLRFAYSNDEYVLKPL